MFCEIAPTGEGGAGSTRLRRDDDEQERLNEGGRFAPEAADGLDRSLAPECARHRAYEYP